MWLWHTAAMPTGRHLGHRAPSIADKARIARANRTAADLAPVIAELRAAGMTSLNGIAAALDERGIPTPAGSRHWHAMQAAHVAMAAPRKLKGPAFAGPFATR
jgi:hypothetical protein